MKNAQTNDLTIHGKVTKLLTFKESTSSSIPTSIEVEILEKFKGEETRRFITVLGGTDSDCLISLENIYLEEELILSLIQTKQQEYVIHICGENIARAGNGNTWGLMLYNDLCSIKEPLALSFDSLRMAIDNPAEFMFATKSCNEETGTYYTEVNQAPRPTEDKTVLEYIKERLKVRKDISKRRDVMVLEIFIDETGLIEKISYADGYFQAKKMRRKYGEKIIELIQESSPWVPGKHRNETLPVKLSLSLKIEDLIINDKKQ